MIDINWLVNDSGFEGIEFVCGKKNGNKIISGVHIMDNPDTYRFLKQGELVLTTGYVFKQMKDSEIIEMIKTMNDKGCCGIVFKVHRFYDRVPDFMVKEAKNWNIPILSLPFEVALSDIQMRVLREIFEQERESEADSAIERLSFFDYFFDESITRNQLEYLCLENRFNTKCRYSVFVCDVMDEKKQRIAIEREAFLRKAAVSFYVRNTYLVVLMEIPDYLKDFEINEFMREFAIECNVSMNDTGVASNMDFGVSGFGEFTDVAALVTQAVKAKFINGLLKDIRAITFEEQSMYHFLMTSSDAELDSLGRPIAEKLDDELIVTLEELVFSGWKYKESAEKLFIHRNTLLFRKNKIFEALNVGDNAGQITFLEMRVYAYHILKYVKRAI